jgi:GT2 family glycosyltransferase
MNVSIILVNYNTCKLLINAIDSIYRHTHTLDFEIIVVDNNSNDTSVKMLKDYYPEIILIENSRNIGFGLANNKGIKISKGKYNFLLNTDTYLVTNAVNLFFDFMEKKENANIAVVGGQLYRANGDQCVSWGYFPNFKLFVKGSFWRHFYKEDFYKSEVLNLIYSDDIEPYEVDYVSGANYFVRSEILNIVGGFDKCFFLYFEETELTLRIKRRIGGVKIMIFPKAKIVHLGQASNLNSAKSKKFKLQYLKSRAHYFRIQNGLIPAVMVYLRGLIVIFFNR